MRWMDICAAAALQLGHFGSASLTVRVVSQYYDESLSEYVSKCLKR
jgi:hypothetical protein